jgi:mannose-6-phosphate isomerase-like protein (cupin superfamily)
MILRDGFAVVDPGESKEVAAASGGTVRITIDARSGCRNLVQRLLEVEPKGLDRPAIAGSEEIAYVASGTGRLLAGDDVIPLEPATGFLIPPGTPYRLEPDGSPMSIVSVVCPPSGRRGPDAPDGPGRCVAVREADQEPLPAGESRTFKLLVDPAVGCRGVTQFLGFIEQSRAPKHVHAYEEVIHILGGAGTLHAAGKRIPIERGWSIYLAPGTPHCLENGTSETLRLLGVFSPAGSPADKRED